MPIDPQLQGLVAAVNAAAAEAPADQTVAERREGYRALSSLPGPGPELDVVGDEVVAGVPCRRYANEEASGLFMYVHGGGYTIGDLETHDQVCRQLALESEAIVVSVDYRLAPEHPFPAGIDDAWAVLQALAADAQATGTRLVVGGDSAGGNFSAVLALMARDADIDLAAQLLVYPGVDGHDDSPSMTENGEGYILTRESIEWFGEQYGADWEDWRASPIRAASHQGVAPALVITAELDPLRDQGVRYVERLRACGVEVTHTNYEGMVHAFFQLGPLCDTGARAVTEVATAARNALR